MSGQWLAPRRFLPGHRRCRPALDGLRNIGIQFLERQRQLPRIQSLGPASVLGTLQLFDDLPEARNLAVAMLDKACHVTHQLVQESCIPRQIVKVEPHGRLYIGRD
jgi:hypothetical protein